LLTWWGPWLGGVLWCVVGGSLGPRGGGLCLGLLGLYGELTPSSFGWGTLNLLMALVASSSGHCSVLSSLVVTPHSSEGLQ